MADDEGDEGVASQHSTFQRCEINPTLLFNSKEDED